jgi:glucokinase
MKYLAIEIGGTKLQLVLGDGTAGISARRKIAVDPSQGAGGIRDQIERALPSLVGDGRLRAVGVGFGGPVDWQTGKICRSHHVEGWSDFELGRWLGELVGVPVAVENDANVAALGEARCGAGRGFAVVCYVTLGSGVGGGVVVEGAIYHGAIPGEAEIGHLRLDRSGTIVESRCSGWAVDARIRRLKHTAPDSLLGRLAAGAEGGEARHLATALRTGDEAAKLILEEMTEDLAFGLSHVVHLFHPQVIVIGGGLSHLGEPLRQGVERSLGRFIMEAFLPGPRVALALLGEDAVPVGALELAKDRCQAKMQ